MRGLLRGLLTAAAIVCASHSAAAATYYVATNGNDGTARDPDPETTSPDDRGTWHRNL